MAVADNKKGRSCCKQNGIFFAVLLFAVLSFTATVFADSLPRLPDRAFQSELIGMADEYDKDVTPQQAAKNPYINDRLIVKSYNSSLNPEDYGAIDAIRDMNQIYPFTPRTLM